MSTDSGTAPEPAERGRYAVYETRDGGLLIARTAGLCDRCRECGCGEPRDPVGPVSGALVQMAKAAAAGKLSMTQAVKGLISRG